MARFIPDANQLNHTVVQSGREYNLRLVQRAQVIFSTLLDLLPSNWISAVQGPNYTVELKAVALEIARLELALEAVNYDIDFTSTRTEFLYSIIGYLVFANGRLPKMVFDDEDFRKFLLSVISIYFKGSIPNAIEAAVELFVSGGIQVNENFLAIRKGASGLDISDQFGFTIDIPCEGGFPPSIFDMDATLRQLIDIIRPAHTLYRIRYVFREEYLPNSPLNRILDTMHWKMADYHYDDIRSFWAGIRDRDRLGKKVGQQVLSEDHSGDF